MPVLAAGADFLREINTDRLDAVRGRAAFDPLSPMPRPSCSRHSRTCRDVCRMSQRNLLRANQVHVWESLDHSHRSCKRNRRSLEFGVMTAETHFKLVLWGELAQHGAPKIFLCFCARSGVGGANTGKGDVLFFFAREARGSPPFALHRQDLRSLARRWKSSTSRTAKVRRAISRRKCSTTIR